MSSSALKDTVNSILEIPYSKEKGIIERPNDIIKVTEQEWMSIKSKPMHYIWYDLKGNNKITDIQKRHISSIRVDSYGWKKDYKKLYKPFYKRKYGSEFISIEVGDYILQRPDILQDMLKVAENPCNYIENSATTSERNAVEYYRRQLNCDKAPSWPFKPKRWVFFVIKSSEREGRDMHILLHRKDLKY